MFSHPVKPHPWPLPTHSTRPHRDTGNAVSEFGMFLGCEALGCAGSKGSEPSSAEPRLRVSSSPGCLPPAVLQGGMGAARPRDPCQCAGGFRGSLSGHGTVTASPRVSQAGCGCVPVRPVPILGLSPLKGRGHGRGSARGSDVTLAAGSRRSVPRHTCSWWAL